MAERICKHCGDANPADAQFCIDCGAALTSASTGATTRLPGMVCPACYAHNPDDARFCAACGRSFAPQPQAAPRPQPARPPARPAAPPRQSYPRTATPPQLTPYRPAPPAYRPAAPRRNPGPFVFLAGLAILLINGAIWPGILVLIGLSVLFTQLAQGHTGKALSAMVWFGGVALLFSTGRFWPGIMIIVLLGALLDGWGGSHRRWW